MKLSGFHSKVVAIALTAVMALGTVAPAFAGNSRGHGKKWRRGEVAQTWSGGGYRVYRAPARTYYRSRYHSGSNAGPVIAGIIGGIAIGAILANSAHSDPYRYSDRDVYYVDPYCGRSYASLNVYLSATYGHHHPRLVRVYDHDSDRCLRTVRYSDGGWSDCGAGYGDYSDAYYEDHEIEHTYEHHTIRHG